MWQSRSLAIHQFRMASTTGQIESIRVSASWKAGTFQHRRSSTICSMCKMRSWMRKEIAKRAFQGVLGIKIRPHDLLSLSAQDTAAAQPRNKLPHVSTETGLIPGLYGQSYLEKGLRTKARTCLTHLALHNWPVHFNENSQRWRTTDSKRGSFHR